MATGDNINSNKLGIVAAYSLNNEAFRRTASDPDKVEDAVRSDSGLADALANDAMEPLNDEEVAYCMGWAALASVAFGGDDGKLVEALNQQAGDEGPGP